ncbi:histidine--tRNA ligase [Parvularcula sp. IMCC14364]|uniref:histidine--tRNA ligase n=1 Tax=Parvularcula sp. IMCC14364 TaxID=3067902 RepID=UPI00274219F2|nr:histidine--tRNA ligase [Parvularcula sp. IMCC14364]
MSKKQKTFKPKARKPRGFADRLGQEILAEQAMLTRIQAVYAAYGFDPLETPAFEFTDALGKFLPDVDRPGQGVFSLQDDDEQWMSLRYDLTAPLARFVAEHYDALPKPFRRYQVGRVWRNEKPGPGRYREFTQCDADIVGAPAPFADAEICMMFADAVEAAGVPRGDYVIRVSDRKAMNGLLEVAGLAGEDMAAKRLGVLRAMDKLDRLGEEGVRLLLGDGREDESGDYTQGAGLSAAQADVVMAFMAATKDSNAATCAALRDLIGESSDGMQGVENLEKIAEVLTALSCDESRVQIDLSIVRGLEYYTGPVFEADLTFEVEDEKGRPVRFGSVGGGGRYDDLVKRFRGQEVPAVGCSVGVSRLLSALQARGHVTDTGNGPIVVMAMDKDQMPAYQKMAAELRAAGLRAEVFVGSGNFGKQMKYADRRSSPMAIIQGEDERAKGEVTLKDLVLGEKLAAEITDNRQWREDQPAQFSVPREKMVDAVKDVLSRGQSTER